MEESKKADAQKTEMLRQMHEDQKEQAAERLSVMKSLNDNMAKLIEKLWRLHSEQGCVLM